MHRDATQVAPYGAAYSTTDESSGARRPAGGWRICRGGVVGCYAFILLTCFFSSGCCRLLGLSYRTTVFEPRLYNTYGDSSRSLAIYTQWADQAWLAEGLPCLSGPAQADYEDGFRDGFIDYVYAGGTGEPPPVPPRVYWNVLLRTESGKERVHQWFDGFRHGARVAREGGYREMSVVSTSVAGVARNGPPNMASPEVGPNNAAPAAAIPLPPPRPDDRVGTPDADGPVNPFTKRANVSPADLALPSENANKDSKAANEKPSATQKESIAPTTNGKTVVPPDDSQSAPDDESNATPVTEIKESLLMSPLHTDKKMDRTAKLPPNRTENKNAQPAENGCAPGADGEVKLALVGALRGTTSNEAVAAKDTAVDPKRKLLSTESTRSKRSSPSPAESAVTAPSADSSDLNPPAGLSARVRAATTVLFQQ